MRWSKFLYQYQSRPQHMQFIVIFFPFFISVAVADAAAPTSCEVSAPCRRLLLQGSQQAVAGHHERALDAFNRALRMTDGQDTRLIMEIARTLHLLRRIDEAVDMYRRYLQAVPQDSPGRDIVLGW